MTAPYPHDPWARGSECPDAELLAAYLDGVVEPAERDAVESHLADCALCRAALAETVAFISEDTPRLDLGVVHQPQDVSSELLPAAGPLPETVVLPFRSRWRPARVAMLAAAAVLVIVAGTAPQWLAWNRAGSGPRELRDLIAAVAKEPNRPLEGRLTGGFAYGPPPVVMRGSRTQDVSAEVRVAATTIETLAEADTAITTLAARAVAYLVTGELDKGIAALEDVVQREPSNPRYLADLSAAYIARATRQNRSEDWNKALSAANRAIGADPALPEAYFNRALALDGMQRVDDARLAWDAYRRLDTASEWSQEAAARARK